MSFLWKPKFIFANLFILLAIKAAIAPLWLGVASITQEPPTYSRNDIIFYTNQYRENSGLKPLIESTVLDIAAAQKLQDMLQKQYFAHFSPDGISPWHWFEVNMYSYTHAGENLAIGFSYPQAAVTAWANSPSHRRNLVNENYREIGVAVEQGKINDISGVIVVQFFGAPVKSAPQVADSSNKKSGLSIGLSQSGAKSTETPVPSPSPNPSLLAQPVVPLAAKTPPSSPLAVVPQTSSVETEPIVNRIARFLDVSFMAYALIIAILAVAYFVFSGVRRKQVFPAAAHVVIFLLSILIPLSEAIQHGFIF